jgi:glycosyltransferase involved in cell wall biosynthesis
MHPRLENNTQRKSMRARKQLKILILSCSFRPSIGGVETHLTDLTEYLRSRGHKVYVLTYTPLMSKVSNAPLREKTNGIEVHRIPWFGLGLKAEPWIEPYRVLWVLSLFPPLFVYTLIFLLRHKVDVIHAHALIPASIAGLLSKPFRTRAIMSVHGLFELGGTQRFFSRFVLNSLDSILALSKRSRQDAISLGVPENKVAIYRHWVDQSLFRPPLSKNEVRKRLGFKEEDFVVLFVGRLLRNKGVEVLLKVAEKCPDAIEFVFIGVGPMEDEIRTATKRLRNVKLIGKLPVATLVKYYGAADLVAAPPQYEEGFSRVILESLSCGTPVLAANRGCLVEMVDESVGRLTHPDVEHVYGQIIYFYENQDELTKLAAECRNYAEKEYSERNAEFIVKAYIGELS